MKASIWALTTDDDHSGHQVELYGSEQTANAAAAEIVKGMAEQNGHKAEVTAENWQEVHSELMDRLGFSDFIWLDEREVELDLGPLAITIEGGAVQDAVSDDKRLHGLNLLVVDYDIDGAEYTYNVTQKNHKGETDGVSEAVVTDAAVCAASGIDLAELWHNFTHGEDGLDDEEDE
jgi:hypothetical protein